MIFKLIQLNIKDATQSMYLKDRGTLYFSDDQQATYMITQHIDVIKSILQKIQTNPNIEVFIEQDIAKEVNRNVYLIENVEDLRVYEPFQVNTTTQDLDDEILEKHMIAEPQVLQSNDENDETEVETEKSEKEIKTLSDEDNQTKMVNDENTEAHVNSSPSEGLHVEREQEENDLNSDEENQSQIEDEENFKPLSYQEIARLISELDNFKHKNNIESVGEMLSDQMNIYDNNTGEGLNQSKRASIFKGILLYLFKDRHVNGLERTMENSFNQFDINEIAKESFKQRIKQDLKEMDEQSIEYFIYNHFYQVIRSFDIKINHFTCSKRN